MLQRFRKSLKVGKTERYSYGITKWLGVESITSASIRAGDHVSYSAVTISGATMSFYATGLSVGCGLLFLDYTTANRSDCAELLIDVVSSGEYPIDGDGFLDASGTLFNDSELFNNAELYT